MELVQTLSTNNKLIIKKLSSIYGIDKCASAIESYAKYIELNKDGNIKFGNYNVLIKCSSTYIDSEKLVNVLEELLEINGIINGKHIYIEPRQLKSNLLNTTRRQDMNRQLFIVSSDLVDLNSSTIQSNLNMSMQENTNDIFIVLYKYDKCIWCRNDINLPKLFWKFELDELSEDAKVSYIRNSFKDNGIKVDNKCGLVNYLKNIECEDLQKKLMEIIIKAKSSNVSKLTNKSMSELDLRKYLKVGSTTSSGKGLQELINLQGLDNVKSEVQKIVNYIKINKDRGTTLPSLHMMFYGKPGVGKTTVARIIGKIFAEEKVLSDKKVFVEVHARDLIDKYVGWTSQKVKDIVKSAEGGVLFIDEAYALYNDDASGFESEAIATLIKELEDKRDNLCVIFAGYTGEMKKLLDMNPGFASRINFHIYFEDYNVDELIKIFKNLCKNEKYKIDTGVADILVPFFKREMQKENFSNARLVRNIFEKTKFCAASRVVNDTKANKDYLIADDVTDAIQSLDVKTKDKKKIGFEIGGVTSEST